MGKYSKGLVNDIKKEQEEAAKQAELRRRYNVEEEENVIIKEKTNTFKFIVRLLISGIQLVVRIFIVLMAALGCIAIIYPEVRAPLLVVLGHIIQELTNLLRF